MPEPSLNSDKPVLRRRFREARRGISDAARQAHDQAINRGIEQLAAEFNARRIAAYLAFDGEPDIGPALRRLNDKGIEIYLPVISAAELGNELNFRRWPVAGGKALPGDLRKNSFGIQEPLVGDICAVEDIDLMLIPLVAWDKTGGRLGMGAGYYDRALRPVASRSHPRRIGIAYEIQCADSVPMGIHDVPLHGVLNESGLFTCAG